MVLVRGKGGEDSFMVVISHLQQTLGVQSDAPPSPPVSRGCVKAVAELLCDSYFIQLLWTEIDKAAMKN